VFERRRLAVHEMTQLRRDRHYEVAVADIPHTRQIFDGHMFESVPDAKQAAVVIPAKLPCIRLPIACRQAALAIATTPDWLCLVYVTDST
jgi:hypothetical protein